MISTDLLQELEENTGFYKIAALPVNRIIFSPEFRVYCEENTCGHYDCNYACPPSCGTPEDMENKARQYENAIIFQSLTKISDYSNNEEIKDVKKMHNLAAFEALRILEEHGYEGDAAMAGPCSLCRVCGEEINRPCPRKEGVYSCLSAYCINVGRLCEDSGLTYLFDDNRVAFFSIFFYNE